MIRLRLLISVLLCGVALAEDQISVCFWEPVYACADTCNAAKCYGGLGPATWFRWSKLDGKPNATITYCTSTGQSCDTDPTTGWPCEQKITDTSFLDCNDYAVYIRVTPCCGADQNWVPWASLSAVASFRAAAKCVGFPDLDPGLPVKEATVVANKPL